VSKCLVLDPKKRATADTLIMDQFLLGAQVKKDLFMKEMAKIRSKMDIEKDMDELLKENEKKLIETARQKFLLEAEARAMKEQEFDDSVTSLKSQIKKARVEEQ